MKRVRPLNSWGGITNVFCSCISRVPDSAAPALFLLMEDAALIVDSALGRVTLLVSLLLIVLSVHASGPIFN